MLSLRRRSRQCPVDPTGGSPSSSSSEDGMATRPSSVPAGQSSSSYDSMPTPLGRACRRAGGRALPGSAGETAPPLSDIKHGMAHRDERSDAEELLLFSKNVFCFFADSFSKLPTATHGRRMDGGIRTHARGPRCHSLSLARRLVQHTAPRPSAFLHCCGREAGPRCAAGSKSSAARPAPAPAAPA